MEQMSTQYREEYELLLICNDNFSLESEQQSGSESEAKQKNNKLKILNN